MSYRRLWVLLNRLPRESWTQTELRDSRPDDALVAPVVEQEQFGPWGLGNYQLANIADAIRHAEWVMARLKGAEIDAPSLSPRPGASRPVRKRTAAQVAYLNALRARKAVTHG